MIGKGQGWLHCFCLIELFPGAINFIKNDLAELAKNNETQLFGFLFSYNVVT
jgi:hypothetical protein